MIINADPERLNRQLKDAYDMLREETNPAAGYLELEDSWD